MDTGIEDNEAAEKVAKSIFFHPTQFLIAQFKSLHN